MTDQANLERSYRPPDGPFNGRAGALKPGQRR
jgi:hypothetical protein